MSKQHSLVNKGGKTLIRECICQPLWFKFLRFLNGPRALMWRFHTTVNKTGWERNDGGPGHCQWIMKVLIMGLWSPTDGINSLVYSFPQWWRRASKVLTVLLGEIHGTERHKPWSTIRQAWKTPRVQWSCCLAWMPKSEHQASDHSFTEFPGLDAEKEVTKVVFYSKGHWLCLVWWVRQSIGFK